MKRIIAAIMLLSIICTTGCSINIPVNIADKEQDENEIADTDYVYDAECGIGNSYAEDNNDDLDLGVNTVYYQNEFGEWLENEKAVKFKLRIFDSYLDTSSVENYDRTDELLSTLQGVYYTSKAKQTITISDNKFIGEGSFFEYNFNIKHIYDVNDVQLYIDDDQNKINENYPNTMMFTETYDDRDIFYTYKLDMLGKRVFNKHYILFGQVEGTEDYQCVNMFMSDNGMFTINNYIFTDKLDPTLEDNDFVQQLFK